MDEDDLLERLIDLRDNEELSDFEFVRELAKLDKEVLDMCSDDDYVINRPQYRKLIAVLEFFIEEAKENPGIEIEPVKLSPRAVAGGVEVTFKVFDLWGQKLKDFAELLKHASAFGIDTTIDGKAGLGITIPDVFVKQK